MNTQNLIRTVVRGATPVVLAALLALPAAAQFSTSLPLPPIHQHAEEALPWCGPAAAEMIVESYPSGACDKSQDELWVTILGARVESSWDTDPAGMRAALLSCPPPGGSWSIFSETTPQALMYAAARWMALRNYPVAVLLETAAHNSYMPHQEHWVVLHEITTDVDPRTTTTVNLLSLRIVDPAVPLGNPPLPRFISGSSWYTTELKAVAKVGSAYNGKFVAVIEPPPSPGKAVAPRQVLTGTVISADKAARFAAQAISKFQIARSESFRRLASAKFMEPLLVNPKQGGYYLVPFTVDGRSAEFAVLVNAYTGEFQEAGALPPTRFLSRREALERALGPGAQASPSQVRADLRSESALGAARYWPAWRVEVEGRPIIVKQDERRDPR